MPKFLETALQAEARKKGLTGKAAERYTFGAMNNLGAMRGSKETAKGARMQAKHDRQMKEGTAEQEIRHPKTHAEFEKLGAK